ncbi:TolC family protein [Zoogloea sp.]|uniref:TolC family protein n=1 Tax=Zoogloea sp. TaxID=49181 RepID=UPI0035AD93B5
MRRLFALFVLLCCALVATARPATAGLSELLDAAWQRDPRARALDARRDELSALSEVAAGWTPGPGSVGIANRNDRPFDNRGRQEWELEYAQPVWLPGQAAARRDEAGTALRALDAERAALRLELARRLVDTRLAWLLARGEAGLAERRLTVARQLSDDLARRVTAGEAPRFDLNLAQSERLAAEAAVAEQDLAARELARRFQVLAGSLPPPTLDVSPAEAAVAPHPGLVAAREATALARARLATTRQSLRDNPEVGLRLRRERDASGAEYGDSISLRLVIPLTSAPRTAAREAAAIAAVTERVVAAEQLRHQFEQDRAQAADQLATAARLEDAARARQRLAADNLGLADTAWRLGERPLEALLRARAAAFDADIAALRARHTREQAEAWRDYLKGSAE